MIPLTIGFIGLGHVGKALSVNNMQAGNRVLLSMGFAAIDLGGLVEGG